MKLDQIKVDDLHAPAGFCNPVLIYVSCGGLCAGRAFLIPRNQPIETLAKQYNSWLWGTRIQDLNQFSQEYRKNSEVFRSIQNNSEQFRTIQTEFRQYLEVFRQYLDVFRHNLDIIQTFLDNFRQNLDEI